MLFLCVLCVNILNCICVSTFNHLCVNIFNFCFFEHKIHVVQWLEHFIFKFYDNS